MSRPASHRRGRTSQRRRLLGASLLRAAGPDHLRAGRLGPSPLPAAGAPPDRLHRLRPAHRADARRDRRRAREATSPPRAHPPRLVAPLGHLERARIDERIAELERLKLGLTECIGCGCLSLDRCQLANPGDRAARTRPRPALLDRRPAAEPSSRRQSQLYAFVRVRSKSCSHVVPS